MAIVFKIFIVLGYNGLSASSKYRIGHFLCGKYSWSIGHYQDTNDNKYYASEYN